MSRAVLSAQVQASLYNPGQLLGKRFNSWLAGVIPLIMNCPFPAWMSRAAVHSPARNCNAAEECDSDKDCPAKNIGYRTMWLCSQLNSN